MMKLVVLLVVVVVAAWLFMSRTRAKPPAAPKAAPKADRQPGGQPPAPATMLACVHCGVHLPQPDTVQDAAGRPYCSEAHRLAGPR